MHSQRLNTVTPIVAAIDVAGGDHGLAVAIPAVLHRLATVPELQATLVGDQRAITDMLESLAPEQDLVGRIHIEHASETVSMADNPAQVVKAMADSSLRVAIQLAVEGAADFCLSAGNTGAMVGLARRLGKRMPGVGKLAMCAELPTVGDTTVLLDVGATVDCTPVHLHQFGKMGSALACIMGCGREPSVRCLGSGHEESKGNAVVLAASKLLEADHSLYFQGLIEASDLHRGDCNVVVCDGFVGNVALKSSEGTARYIAEQLLSSADVCGADLKMIDPAQYNGAFLLGLQTLVIKSHGGAGVEGTSAALHKGVTAVRNSLQRRLAQIVIEQ